MSEEHGAPVAAATTEETTADQLLAEPVARTPSAEVRATVEALIFASPEPITPRTLCRILAEEPKEDVLAAVDVLRADYENRPGLQLDLDRGPDGLRARRCCARERRPALLTRLRADSRGHPTHGSKRLWYLEAPRTRCGLGGFRRLRPLSDGDGRRAHRRSPSPGLHAHLPRASHSNIRSSSQSMPACTTRSRALRIG